MEKHQNGNGKHPLFSKFSFSKQKSQQESNLSAALSDDNYNRFVPPIVIPQILKQSGEMETRQATNSDLDSDSDSGAGTDSDFDDANIKSEESIDDYKQGGYHPTFIGERYGSNNQYRIIRKLGWGHFSTVWLSWDEDKHRHVAIKIVRSSTNYKEAAIDEIKILESVNNGDNSHPGKHHIVELLDHFIHNGPNGEHVCMVFEVLGENMLNLLVRYKDFKEQRKSEIEASLNSEGNSNGVTPKVITDSMKTTNLADLQILSNSYGGLPISLVKQISKQMLLALDYLHRVCGIIHTDLKPENVLVEISDVERLVKLLELERKNKKMMKILERRKANKSISDNKMRPKSIPIPMPKSRKNSIPVRSSKPLTSPLEKSSVDNFFRSFSFSQRSNSNGLSSSNSSLNSYKKRNLHQPVSYAKTASLDDYNGIVIEEEDEEDEKENMGNKDVKCLKLNLTNETADDTDIGSITEAEDIFVDAREFSVPITKSNDLKPPHLDDQFDEFPHDTPQLPGFDVNEGFKRRESTFSTVSHKSILNEFESIISIKIADLGNACWYNKHYTSDIQTRQYRAPEVILGGDWGCSTDIWSLSCLIFELITGDYLFDPRSTKSYTRDEDHLAQMVELLEEWPPIDYIRNSSRWEDYFDSSCSKFRRISKLKMWSLEKVLKEEYGMKEVEASELGKFLRCGLQYQPRDRIDAGSLYSHTWLKDVEGSEGSFDRAFGLRGPDIKGWYCLANTALR